MILHVFNDQKKFSKGYFKMLKDHQFDLDEMELIHHGKEDNYFKDEIGIKTIFVKSYLSIIGNIRLIKKLRQADKIVVHSLAAPALLLAFSMSKKLQKKTTWVIWGKDLYFYQLLRKRRFYHKVYEFFRKKSIKNIGTIVTILEEDYHLLKEWYEVSGRHIECNDLYHYSIDTLTKDIKHENVEKLTVLLGNSGSVTNNHINAIDKIKNCSNIEKIYCPLSYGGKKSYYQKVIEHGKSVFGEKFIPLTEFMKKDEYEEMLNSVDVGVFNYNRQEGLGNIWMLMFMGKTIYLNSDTATGKFFDRIGVEYKKFDNVGNGLNILDTNKLKQNQEILGQKLTVEISVEKWRKILYE